MKKAERTTRRLKDSFYFDQHFHDDIGSFHLQLITTTNEDWLNAYSTSLKVGNFEFQISSTKY